MSVQFTSPVARIVQGDAFEPQLKNQQGAPRVVQSGPNAGQPAPQWFLALAHPKGTPETNAHLMEILGAAATSWPSLFPNGVNLAAPNFGCVMPTFASKIIDGDGFDTAGKSNATKEGFAGHWVVRYTSGYAPKCYPHGRHAPADMITDPKEIRRGYYARIAGTIDTNANPTKPGMYVNVGLVELAGKGVEIVSGPDAGAAFSTPVTLPPGATALPGPAPGTPPNASAAFTPPAPPTPPATPAAPYTGYMAPSAGLVMLPAANGATYEAMKAAGWTDEAMIAQGMMAAQVAIPTAPVAPPPAPPAPPPAPVGRTMLPAANGVTYEAMKAAGWTDETLIAHGMMAA